MTEPREQQLPGTALSDAPESVGGAVFRRKPERKRIGRSWPARIAVALFSLVLMLGVGIGVIFAALSRGPIEVPFLSERVASGLEERLGQGIDVDVGRTVLEKDANGLSLHVLDVVLKDDKGRELLRSPDAIVGFNPLQLLGRKIVPERLALRGMSVRAEVTPEGELLFRTGGARQEATAATAPGREVAAFLFGYGGNPGGGLSALSIEDAELTVHDQRNGRRLSFQNLALGVTSAQGGVVEAKGSLRKDGDVVPFTIAANPSSNGRLVTASINGIGDDTIQALLGLRSRPFTAALKVGLDANLTVSANGELQSSRLRLTTGGGSVIIPSLDALPFLVEQFALTSEWLAAKPGEAQLSAAFTGGGSRFQMAGPLTLPENNNGVMRWFATGSDWSLSPLAPGERPVTADKVELAARFDKNAARLTVDRLTVAGPGTRIAINGSIARDGDSAALKLALDAGPMPIRSGLRWWPFFVSQPARRFLIDTVKSGDMPRLSIGLDMPGPVFARALQLIALPREALMLDVVAENASVVLADGMPAVAGLALQGKLDPLNAQGVVNRAFVDMRQGRRIQLSDGAFALNRLDSWTPDATIRFKSSGALDTLAEFLKSPAMKTAFGLDVDPATVRGQFDGSVSIALPLANQLKSSDIRTEVEGRMTGVTVDKAIGKDRLENATLTVSTDRTGVEIKGEGRWQGTPVTLSLERDAADGSLATVMALTLDDAALRRRGFNLGSQLTGTFPVKIRAQRNQGEMLRAGIEADLTRATIDGLLPGFQKPAGRPGRLSFDAIERPGGGYTVQNLTIDSGAASFRGQAEAQADGSVTSAKFSLFRLSPGDNVRLDFDKQGNGGKVVIRGNNFDVRPFLRQASSPERGRAEPDRELDLDIRTTLLSGYGGEVITGAEARIQLRSGQLRQINLIGRLNGKPVSITGRGGEGAAPVTIDSEDGGALLRFLDLYSRMVGGELRGQLSVLPRRITGYFQTKDFTLRNEPAIRRLVAEGSAEQSRNATVDARFTKMRMDFTREGNETTIRDAVIFGPQLGLTFNGVVDSQRDRISLSGTYVPAFGLNNAFAQIPIVGNILGGGRNEGLLAVTFGVSGRASQPNVTVNPLSAVAPGIFRKIFEFRNDTTAATPTPIPRNPSAE